jgi:hypothetical protein
VKKLYNLLSFPICAIRFRASYGGTVLLPVGGGRSLGTRAVFARAHFVFEACLCFLHTLAHVLPDLSSVRRLGSDPSVNRYANQSST